MVFNGNKIRKLLQIIYKDGWFLRAIGKIRCEVTVYRRRGKDVSFASGKMLIRKFEVHI